MAASHRPFLSSEAAVLSWLKNEQDLLKILSDTKCSETSQRVFEAENLVRGQLIFVFFFFLVCVCVCILGEVSKFGLSSYFAKNLQEARYH